MTMELQGKDDPTGDEESENRNEIRSELSKMSFEELRKLKERLGSKIYKEAMYGKTSGKVKTEYKRLNKNRPREVSSKVKPVLKKKVVQKNIVDPRFNRLCGTFNKKHFDKTYDFLNDIRKNEKKQLQKMLKTETRPGEIDKIKYLLQRMKNQEQEQIKLSKRQEREEQEKREQIAALESGKRPHFKTKYEKKIVDLVDKYSSLKKTGKIEKYIQKKQKKATMKEKKRTRYFDVNIDELEN